MANNSPYDNMDSYSNFQHQPVDSSQLNDEWSCITDEWSYIEQPAITMNSNVQKLNSTINSDSTLNHYSVQDSNIGTVQSLVNQNRPPYIFNNGNENGQHKYSSAGNNWFDKSENQIEQMVNVQHNINQDFVGKKCDNTIETDDNFWVDVENREILPPESFQNDSLQAAMNNIQINDEMINSNACDNFVTFNNAENVKRNPVENDDDKPPVGLHRLVTGQTKSFEDYSNPEPCGPQPFDVRTVPGQLSDDDIPVQRKVTGSQIGTRQIDNNLDFQSVDNNSLILKRLPSLEQFQNQFECHSRQVIHRDVEDFVNHPNDDSVRGISDTDNYTSIRSESQPEVKELLTVIKRNRPKITDHEVFERTGPDGYMNETSPYLRSTAQNQIKPIVDPQQDNSLKLLTSTQDSIERFQEFERMEKRTEKKHPPLLPGFHRMVEGNIGEEGVQKSKLRLIEKIDDRQRRHSVDSDSSVPLNNPVSEDGRKNIRRGPEIKKYNKNGERYHNRERRNRHPRESEEDYFYEEEEDNASLSPDVDPEYRSIRSRNHQSKQYRQRIPHENYDHSDLEYPSEYDEFEEYDRRRRYRSPESDRYRRHHRSYRDRRYQDEISGQYYRKDDTSYRNRPSSRTDSDYRRYSSSPILDYTAYIELLDPSERKSFLLKFRESNPKAYLMWYTNYKAKVEMQKLISRNKNGSECSTPLSTQLHDVGSLNHMVRLEKEKENHRNTPPRYQKHHINAKMNLGFGKLFTLDSSKTTINIFKAMPFMEDSDTAELFQLSAPFVLGKTHKNTVIQYLNKLAEETINNSERLLIEFIRMITKRNGIICGSDISELLMDNVGKYPVDGILSENINCQSHVKAMPVESLQNCRELLLQGDKPKTLELAMTNQDWGLAFTLASYMDSKTFNYVRSKYFQTIPQNDILQTFFQLSNGRIPSCTTLCVDGSWGSWRKHLAMILSNQHSNINIARSAIIQLGDTLNAKGDVFGAHFCYLSIQIPMESIGLFSKYILLGMSSNEPFNTSATNRAILLTSAYEFAMQLNINNFYISSLLPYKYLLATRLAEYGECEHALHYLEAIATQVISSSGSVNLGFIANVVELSTDLHYMEVSNTGLPASMDVLDWLEDLKCVLKNAENPYKSVDNPSPAQQVDSSQSHHHQSELPVVHNDQQTISDTDYSTNYQIPVTQVSFQKVQEPPPPTTNPYWQPNTVSPVVERALPSLQIVQQPPPPTTNPYWQPNVVSPPTEPVLPPQNDYTQYYDPSSMTITEEITNQTSLNEMTSEISTIAPDTTLIAESENTISTMPKFGFFDRQMAELEPKGLSVGENKSAIKKDTDNKRPQKEKNSWLGGLTKFWKPSSDADSTGENFGNEMAQPSLAAPPMDSELQFNPVANSSPASQTQNQYKIEGKRRVKNMYVNVLSNNKPAENILVPDSMIQTSQQPVTIFDPSKC